MNGMNDDQEEAPSSPVSLQHRLFSNEHKKNNSDDDPSMQSHFSSSSSSSSSAHDDYDDKDEDFLISSSHNSSSSSEEDDDDFDNEDENEFVIQKRSKSKRKKAHHHHNNNSSSRINRVRISSTRKSPRNKVRINYNDDSDENDVDDDVDDVDYDNNDKQDKGNNEHKGHKRRVNRKRLTKKVIKNNIDDDDASFHMSSDIEYDDDEDQSNYDIDFEEESSEEESKNIGKTGNDEMSFEDEIDDDSQEQQNHQPARILNVICTPTRQSSRLRTKGTKKKISYYNEKDDFDSNSDDNDASSIDHHDAQQPSSSTRHAPRCNSTTDEITMEPLPPLHVCYLAPDGITRHCFKIETLYRASMMSGIQKQKKDGSGLALLQPPHFRTVMDDGLMDQIACRFGRKALMIEETDFFKKERKLNVGQQEYQVFIDSDDEDYESRQDFSLRFNRYLAKAMGNGDLYVCCICYAEAQRRFRGETTSDDDDSDIDENEDSEQYSTKVITSSKIDPMSILGGLDDDEFETASCFCFTKLASVKAHIRSEHHEDTKLVRGNDLYQRFKIRSQDGLLQNHLRAYWQSRLGNNAMQMYWAEGHNQSYIFLRHLIERRELSLSRTDEDDVCEFCTSFPNRSKKIWSTLSAPYMYDDDDEAFIVDDGSESFDQYERPVFEKPTNLEDEIVQHLRKKRHIPDSDDDGSDDNSGSEADELSIVENIDHHGNGIDEEDEDSLVEPHNQDLSDDEWVTNKMTAKPKHKKSSVKKTPVKKSRLSRSKLNEESDEESDDDDEVFSVRDEDEMDNKISSSDKDTGSSRKIEKKRYCFSSDEESS